MLKFKLWILIPLIMLVTVVCFSLFIFYGSYNMILENSKIELLGTTDRLNELLEKFRLENRLKAVAIANQIAVIPGELKKNKALNTRDGGSKLKIQSMIVGKLELNYNSKSEYIIAYYSFLDKTLISLKEDEILNLIISSEFFTKVKENNIFCDIFTHRNKIYIVTTAPVIMEDSISGSVIVVKMIDDSFAYNLKDITSFDISIFSGDNLIGSTFRQNSPEVLVSIMQNNDRILLHGRLKGKDSPYFPQNIPAMITVSQNFIPDKNIRIAVTSHLSGKFSELREIQFIVLVVLIGVLIIGVIVSFSISRTVYSSVNLIKDSLSPAIKGNFSVQIPENKIPSPFDELTRMINKLLFVARERITTSSKSSNILSEDIKRTITGEIKVQPKVLRPISQEINKDVINQPSKNEGNIEPKPMPVDSETSSAPRPLSGEIFVGNELSYGDVGEMIEDERGEGYNPDATMVASLEQIEELDRAKLAAKSSDLDDIRKLFDKYIGMRLDNGESIENLNFDNFLEKIKNTKADLIKKGNYTDVRFDVIIKNGKVTLKANPVK